MRVTIERLAFGGDGVAHGQDGRVIFVRGALPGDEVEIEIVEDRPTFCRALTRAILTPSPDRVPAACPHDAQCGGCQLWPLPYGLSLDMKIDAALEAIRRVSKLALPEIVERVAAPSDRRYRRRLRLHLDDAGRTGFFQASSRTLTPAPDCLVAHPTLLAARDLLSPHLGGLGGGALSRELARGGDRAHALLAVGRPQAALARLKPLWARPEALGAALAGIRVVGLGRNAPPPADLGQTRFEIALAGLPPDASGLPRDPAPARELDVGAFTQANDAVNALLVDKVVEAMSPAPGDRVLELYCGSGNFSAALAARGASVRGLELDPRAVEDGRRCAERLGEIGERLDLSACDLSRGLPRGVARAGAFDKVLLDPPRTGAREVIAGLIAVGAPRLVYVSCDPPTLGRDLGRLAREGGYRIEAMSVFDMFPRTYHVEVLATCVREDR